MIYHTQRIVDTNIDPLSYLKNHPLYPKVFWKAKNSSNILLGLGCTLSFSHVPTFKKEDQNIPYFGGMFFDATKPHTNLWKDFPPCLFFIPRMVITLHPDGRCTLDCYSLKKNVEPMVNHFPHFTPSATSSLLQRKDNPDFSEWSQAVEHALSHIHQGSLHKVVLARATSCLYEKPVDPYTLLYHLMHKTSSCTLFGYVPSSSSAFVGASPELLYTRVENTLYTEAIAGTICRAACLKEDELLKTKMLVSQKLERELHYVTNFLSNTLSSLCTSYEKQEVSILSTASLHHLHQRFSGRLHPDIDDATLIQKLHPTPAIGGAPLEMAKKLILQHEPFERGLYAAPLGWVSPANATMCVAIRSALISKNQMTLFAGAGIVEGSSPYEEWEELDGKIAPFNYAGMLPSDALYRSHHVVS